MPEIRMITDREVQVLDEMAEIGRSAIDQGLKEKDWDIFLLVGMREWFEQILDEYLDQVVP
jgi:hypothetical protein